MYGLWSREGVRLVGETCKTTLRYFKKENGASAKRVEPRNPFQLEIVASIHIRYTYDLTAISLRDLPVSNRNCDAAVRG